ncbi:type I-C CRISPR-associated protein Cas8c/Csd1 [Fuchsiella alkaliacetigena]|uniref:type I-C CRISPR-associated protein Cas8c/Csd1 n=1 Tax=Fuchsiella alkaliacetigena TaxID=957042 RepID=UPI00200B4BAF|nr:type I-C CRISPR-associated protein Cas8c/Csd1 [Fuchsiella alkaliacetigena]MCK8823999.1 type I-C CRISPR-associated protein Cas8c/Csd1 [Fuchsiella alkaliacetigena]
MILEELCKYAARIKDFPPLHFERKELDWILEIDSREDYKFIPLDNETSKEFLMAANLITRSGRAVRPRLLADKVGYVLGDIENSQDEMSSFSKKKLNSFIKIMEECYDETGEKLFKVYLDFIEQREEIEFPEELDNNDWIGVRIKGEDLLEKRSIQNFWQNKQEKQATERTDLVSECMVCGKEKAIADRHPEKLKIPGGHGSGNPLISANEDGFESYGLEASFIAPVCFDCAMLYGKGGNKLLKDKQHRLFVGNVIYLFWTKNDVESSIASIISDPAPEEVRSYINSYRRGKYNELDKEEFYLLALSANQSRVVIRDWLVSTLENISQNIVNYFSEMRIFNPNYEEKTRYYSLNYLSSVTAFKNDDVIPIVAESLAAFALKGSPILPAVLYKTLERVKAEGVNTPRASLLKMFFNSQPGGEIKVEEKLDKTQKNHAYLCGRLFAVIEQIQKKALPGIKSTIVDRFYGTASASPAAVFGNLIRKAQHHLAKLRKDSNKRGIYVNLQKEMEEIMMELSDFPNVLSLKEQGLFALGYYQQKAYRPEKKSDKEE